MDAQAPTGRSRTVDIEGFKLEGAAVVGVAAAASPESPDASEDELHAWRAQTAAAVPPRERPPSAAAAAAHPDLAPLASDADTQPQAVSNTSCTGALPWLPECCPGGVHEARHSCRSGRHHASVTYRNHT
ncbi:uncharacterized protein LOC125231595 isoform X2 [Leguminivora glycinivorella]|uniref:uncharacterized protein LOC125226744 n=1 Tax=Leguminivora glycinivorella TaxID=1035111 RepID=UPI00200C6CC6|nr:uncharacterized protein LOC125226744 [Leguminivora glycinivorella]XP_047988744.1 uncharacterized protein LOC125228288 isoform X2 [Leguminivora glycinivorella]XP_047991989.1 uncharacterized protein LOC125230809 [Leguminivora glycinivorella]XP_047993011.1 uncharacterized protein LOC125231595 isoform X2 [Leguminivora glycinivorella]